MKRMLSMITAMLLFCCAGTAAARAERLSDQALMGYYDRSLFIGDSLVRMFRNYVKDRQKTEKEFLNGIKFYSSYNFQLVSATREKVKSGSERSELQYKGRDVTMLEIITGEKPLKVFILAGLNDRIYTHMDRAERYVEKIVEITKDKAPGTQICFFSLTPVTQKMAGKGAKLRDSIDAYNAWLEEKCAEVGAVYIDIATDLKNEEGLLPSEISSDGEYHLNDRGNAIWAQTLLDFAQAQYDAGLWTPEEAAQ